MLSAAHFAHDCYPAFLGVLLPLLIPKLGLSLAAAGLVASGIRWSTALQPLLGHWADRRDVRRWVIVAPTSTAVCMSLIGVAPGEAVLVVLLLMTGLSHAVFHPAAGSMVTRAAGGRWGKGTAWFMTAGELGRVVGPVFIAAVVAAVGLERSCSAFVPGLFASVLLYTRLSGPAGPRPAEPPPSLRDATRGAGLPVVALCAAMALRAVANVGIVIFYPTLVVSEGISLLGAGLALTVYELGGAAGAYLGGTVSDRVGRYRVLILGLVCGIPVVGTALLLDPSPLSWLLLCLGGFLLLSGLPVELVAMQELYPDNRSYAVGLSYFMKAVGGIVATIGAGVLGDLLGLRLALTIGLAVGLLAVPCLLVRPRPARGVEVQGEP
jgi:FSR family fosmidomycin resistance protein-like MFS transporter